MWMLCSLVIAAPTELVSQPGANLQRPVWAPDASKLAYEANFHDEKRVELFVGPPHPGQFLPVKPRVRNTSALTAGFSRAPTNDVVHEPSFAPASIGRFAYSAITDDGNYDLYISGGTSFAVHPAADGSAAWSPDGARIAFTSSRSGDGDLYVVEVSSIEAEPTRLTSTESEGEVYASWSPDSKQLAYVSHSTSGDNIWLQSLDGEPKRLTTWPGSQVRPTFSPDGSLLAFYANLSESSRFDLYVMEPRVGASPTRLAQGVVPNARGPSWTPGGKHVLYVADDDPAFDPIRLVNATNPEENETLPLDTVGHGDLDVVASGGQWLVAYVAQGRRSDGRRDYKRLYKTTLSPR